MMDYRVVYDDGLDLLEELFGRRRGVDACHVVHLGAVVRIPRIVAGRPGQFVGEGGEEVIHSPSDYGVVVHAHVDVDKANRIADS